MTETRLLDYSMSHPSISGIKGSGAAGVMRYLCHDSGAKRLTTTEAQQLRAAGLWVGVVFEDTATRASAGMAAGHDDALFAEAQAGSIGVPTSCPIFFAVDQDTTAAAVTAYFRGIAAAKIAHPVGVYGSINVVDGILAAGLARYGWQCAAWSKGALSNKAHLYQRLTPTHPVSGTDENVLLRALPLWGAPPAQPDIRPTPAPIPAPTPHPTAPTTEDFMLLVQNPQGPDWWVVRPDLTGRTHIQDQATLDALRALPTFHEVSLSARQFGVIPVLVK